MWRERYLFYLTLIFIIGNLASKHLLPHISPAAAGVCTASALLVIIALTIILLHSRRGLLPLFIPIFLLMGVLNSCHASILGEYRFIGDIAASAPIQELRSLFSTRLASIIPPWETETHSLFEALTMGEKGDIPRHLKEAYRLSGAMHLLALSGLHVGFLYGMLDKVFRIIPPFRGWRYMKGCSIILLLGFYAIFTGASPSICRAVLMASTYEAGLMAEREKHGLNALSVSALIIALINPDAPSSISFQLSFSAMLGIFLVKPPIDTACEMAIASTKVRKILSLCSLSLSCQLFTAPLSYLYFGSFPLISLLTNLLTMPVISAIMATAPAAILSRGIPIIGNWSADLLSYSIQTLNLMAEILSRII